MYVMDGMDGKPHHFDASTDHSHLLSSVSDPHLFHIISGSSIPGMPFLLASLIGHGRDGKRWTDGSALGVSHFDVGVTRMSAPAMDRPWPLSQQ